MERTMMRRRAGGAPIRQAMAARGYRVGDLVTATVDVDPAGRGLSYPTL